MAVAFQLGIDNTSPTITYVPFSPNTVAVNADSGWTPYYTNSGFPSALGLVGDGTSLQISSKDGSFFSITWFGTGIDLYGNATLASFQASLYPSTTASSGTPLVTPGSDLLVSFSNLRPATYTVTLTAQTSSSPSSFIAFDRAVITSTVNVTNLDNVTVLSEAVDDTSIAYRGSWSFQENTTTGNFFHVTSQLGDSAQLTFNGTAISVLGLRDPTAGRYNVTLDGETTQFNAQSAWKEDTTLFYMTGLDPERTHSLIITNAEDQLLAVGLINTTSVSGDLIPTPVSGISKGAIAGIVVGIFLGVLAFLVLAFLLWRRRRSRGEGRNFNFIEPSIHKGFDITEVLDIQPGQWRKPPAQSQSSASDVSLDLIPVDVPQVTNSRPKPSPPTFPRSPTTSSSLSHTQHLRDASGRGVIHSPETVDQYLSLQIRSPPQVDSENTPLSTLNRRSSVPKPSGPRPQSYRSSTDDPRASVFVPPIRIVIDPDPTKGKGPSEPPEPPEPDTQGVNEGGRMTTYSFLDMNSSSGAPSTIEGVGQLRNSIPPVPHINIDSLHHSLITRTNSTPSRRDFDRRRESGSSKPLSLSVVIQQPSALKCLPSNEPHPYSRPRTGEGVSPTESVPVTMSEVSEIRFSHPGEIHEPNTSQPGASYSQLPTQSPPVEATPATSSIYQKLFGTQQGELPQDGLLAKKRPLYRKALSVSTFSTPSHT